MNKPFSEACERNALPILKVIKPLLALANNLLEIGCGTGQHAVYFAKALPHLAWHTSDMSENHAGIISWLKDANLPNLHSPYTLDVLASAWPNQNFDAVFTANTLHIMSWQAVQATFNGVAKILVSQGLFIIYGPFNYAGKYTSDSNQAFDGWLKSQDAQRGIRDFEAVCKLAKQHQLSWLNDYPMPANNRILVFQKK